MGKFDEHDSRSIYEYLQRFGMYRPNPRSRRCFEELKKKDFWTKAEHIFQRYKVKWSGPDIPVYIFPIHVRRNIFGGNSEGKSGVSFKDKMFLFLTPLKEGKELESIIVHEYHHVCRMNRQKKDAENYTLLDSIILEGLAEHAVLENCGKEYLGPWCNYYTKNELSFFWKKFLSDHLSANRNEHIHDQLLYGQGRYPKLLGYAFGFYMISQYKSKQKNFSDKISFLLPSEKFIINKEY
ncbi:DUF2268 domain-containing protein [Bacillus methanolicus]|uniref:DUF2268 domain-containing protein n=1 Tax=Bacillus methanolicus TaxID=1471 RepID=UPI002380C3A8|nr:DUF2268 domain-containing putative Zn-dependent protease [Bacillus methanolicus]